MGTRCKIEFQEKRTDYNINRRTVYKHWDGCPEVMIPMLEKFLKQDGRAGDVEYQTANFLYWAKKETGEHDSGYGVCLNDSITTELSYFYEVITEQAEKGKTIIKVYQIVFDNPEQGWNLKKENLELIDTVEIEKE